MLLQGFGFDNIKNPFVHVFDLKPGILFSFAFTENAFFLSFPVSFFFELLAVRPFHQGIVETSSPEPLLIAFLKC